MSLYLCPRCAAHVEGDPSALVCPACGYPGQDIRGWQPTPGPSPPPGPLEAVRPRLAPAIGLAITMGVGQVLYQWFVLTRIAGLGGYGAGPAIVPWPGKDELLATLGLFVLAGLASTGLQVAQGFVVGGLMGRVVRNNQRRGVAGMSWSPGWATGAWFIPYANLVIPFLVTREAWRASHPDAPRDPGWRTAALPGWVNAWWAIWAGGTLVVGLVIGVGAQFVIRDGGADWFVYSALAVTAAVQLSSGILFVRVLHTPVAFQEAVGAPRA